MIRLKKIIIFSSFLFIILSCGRNSSDEFSYDKMIKDAFNLVQKKGDPIKILNTIKPLITIGDNVNKLTTEQKCKAFIVMCYLQEKMILSENEQSEKDKELVQEVKPYLNSGGDFFIGLLFSASDDISNGSPNYWNSMTGEAGRIAEINKLKY